MARTVFNVYGYEQITDMDPAVGLTVPEGASFALFTVETAGVRWRADGTAPTAAVGQLIRADSDFLYEGPLGEIEFFETAATAVLNVTYFG